MKRAILFVNLGGPESLKEVKPFLYRLFSDPEIIRIKFSPLRKFIAWLIATSRERKSQDLYASIGGASPIRKLTDEQSRGVEKILSGSGHAAVVRTAFTCSNPLVEDVIKELSKEGVEKILNFPLYPQYSLTTTKGSHDRVRAAVKQFAPKTALSEIGSFPIHPLFIQAHVDLIEKTIAEFPEPERASVHLIFSAHSIPEKLVTELGDPYKREMEQTVQSVLEKLHWKGDWTLSWQSKLGPVKWLGPSTVDVIRGLGLSGVKLMLVVPIAFVTDHIETLHEIDAEFAEEAENAGIEEFRRTPGLNDHPIFLQALADIALSQDDFWN